DSVLQAGSRDREIERALRIVVGAQAVDQPADEGIPAAHAIDDVRDVVARAGVERALAPQHAGPRVMAGGDRAAQGDRDRVQAVEALVQCLADVEVGVRFDLPGSHVYFRRVDAEDLRGVFLVADRHVALRDQVWDYLARLLAPLPQVLAIVEVARDGDAQRPRRFDRFAAGGGSALGDRRSDAGPVEPVGIR